MKRIILLSFLLLLGGMSVSQLSAGDYRIDSPTIELMTAPQGIDVRAPMFCWKLNSKTNGEKQSAYQIVVEKIGDGTVWDTGKVQSDSQTFIAYAGKALEPKSAYRFNITSWNKDGAESASVTSNFTTGIWPTTADPNPWKGKWIGYDPIPKKEAALLNIQKASWIAFEKRKNLPVGRSVYRYTFEADPSQLTEAGAAFAGDNSCRVYLNGEEIHFGSNFKKAEYVDILAKLQKGRNVVAVEAENVGEAPNPGGIIGGIVLKKDRKIVAEFLTGTSWKACSKPVTNCFAAKFDDSDWKNAQIVATCGSGPWGEVTAGRSTPKSVPARYLAREVELNNKQVQRATVYLVGLGYYELFLNGNKVGDHQLDPILTQFNKRVPFNTYDVTKAIKAAKKDLNISVVLGNGRYYPPRANEKIDPKYYGFPKLLFQLEVEYTDGTKQIVVSDKDWKASIDGPIQANNDYDGETYDATKAKYGLPEKGAFTERFANGITCSVPVDQPVQIVPAPLGAITAQMMEPMRITGEIKPLSLKEVKPGVWVYDFGQNFVGWCRLKVRGDRGTEVNLRFAETLINSGANAGMIYTANLRGAKCRDIYRLFGAKKSELYEPRFSYHGFRYVELTGFPGTPDLDTLVGCIVGTDLKITGSFECDNTLVNRIVKNIEWGTRGNYLSIPTDCPQRDERQGWQGDRAVGSKGEMFLFNNSTLYRKWMQDIEDTQLENGNVSDVAPAYWTLYNSNVTWPSAQTIIADSLNLMYGDMTAIKKHYDSRKKWIQHLSTFIKPDRTLDKDNYGDWCVPPEEQHLIHSKDPARKTSKGILATSYLIYNLRLSAKFAKMLGKTKDVVEFNAQADKLTADFNKVFYNKEKGQYDNGTQTSSLLPLAFGIVPKDQKARVIDTLVKNIKNVTKGHLGTGLIGAQWLNRILTDNGYGDISWGFVTEKKFPSWGYMVENGATTVWELWNGDTADPAMNSGNHVMLVGDLMIWLFEDLAGIKTDENTPGFKKIIMAPKIVGNLNWVNAKYDSIRGTVASSWKYDRTTKAFNWNVVIPVNSTAVLYVPAHSVESVKVNGCTPKMEYKNGCVKMELPAGSWSIASKK